MFLSVEGRQREQKDDTAILCSCRNPQKASRNRVERTFFRWQRRQWPPTSRGYRWEKAGRPSSKPPDHTTVINGAILWAANARYSGERPQSRSIRLNYENYLP